ncbi:hypothetical protein FB565_002853 [Actinoplanes lutulentus]|uniref:4-amino-4-deoxy-L-arabinose transferase-like glycosyltransferase n=1 Tax=Actinoplanes lutulentus TaxID=1287878 RepID=A0A327YWM9_9ACTN|nr:hypothetical protein [Actinoplanes lutulentus]MBB2943140.1 hypothetical protein [Actinoplanes lutulentus]RAK25565.1 hypothetical protein B0I29_13227 [Actinoplanes lutulentus]
MSESTAVIERVPAPAPAEVKAERTTDLLRVLPWLVVVAVLLGLLTWSNTPGVETLRYAVYWPLGVLVPGVLVYRALRGSRGNLPEDIGFGATAGIAVQLIGWAIFVSLGIGGVLWVWPLLVIAVFAAVPGLRRHWRIEDPQPLPLAWSWAIAAIAVLAVAVLGLGEWATNPLPPVTHSLFGDIYYHWANAAQLSHTIFPTQPQMAGEPLKYHWFSDAFRASATMISGAELATVMLRLWAGPIVITTVLVIAGLARQASRVWWAGPVAAFVAVALPLASIWPEFSSWPVTVEPWYSPTLTFSIPFVTVVAALLVDMARGVPLKKRGWALFGMLLVVATASKSSSLPVLLGGIMLGGLALWVITRQLPKMMLGALGAAALVLALTVPFLAGGGSGAGIQFGATFSFKGQYIWVVGKDHIPGTGGILPEQMFHVPWGLKLILPALVVCFVISQLGRVLGFAALLRRDIRKDAAAWVLAGIGIAGWAGALLVNHTANGELYFVYSAIPAQAALTAWLLTAVAPRKAYLPIAGGLLAGALTGALLYRFGPGLDGPWQDHWRYNLGRPVIVLLIVLAIGAGLWWLHRRRWPAMVGTGLAVLVAAGIGLGWDTTWRGVSGQAEQAFNGTTPSAGKKGDFWVTQNEMRAAAWLADNAPAEDYVATNVHCEMVKTDADCTNRSFWVSALTEHAVVLEGWAYQPATQSAHGESGIPYFKAASPEPERQRINDAAFSAPTASGLAELRDRYKAKWLYADKRASPVSPELANLATERFRAGDVIVYQLPG